MKHLQLLGLIACAGFFVSCEDTETAGKGNAEAKRAAALQERQQEEAQMDESQKNLSNAQQDILKRDGNPNAGRSSNLALVAEQVERDLRARY